MYDILISLLFVVLGILAWTVVWMACEFYHYQRGHDTYDIIRRIYNKYNLGRIRW